MNDQCSARPGDLNVGAMLRIGFVAAVILMAAASPASADVLISAIPRTLVCGDAITAGIWAQPGTRGNRKVRIKVVDDRTAKVWWHRDHPLDTARPRCRPRPGSVTGGESSAVVPAIPRCAMSSPGQAGLYRYER